MSETFGFPKRRGLSEKLGAITPSSAGTAPPVEQVDSAGELHGFVSREPEVVQLRRRKPVEPVVTLHTRAPVRVAQPFQQFCEKNRYSYWEGIEELMMRAGVHPQRSD
jgi:hypothetical protein